jgi:hypothetical protein
MVTTGDTGTVTNTMLAGSIANAKLTNSSVTVGSTSIALGATSTTLDGVNIGATTPGTGAFTTLSASSTVSGTGFSTYLASPPAIGGTTAAAGAFTTLSASSTVSGTGFSTYLASPPAIGGTAAAAGTFTTLSGATSVTTPIVKSASSLTLQSNGTTTAVTVDTSQNVGIGVTPSYKLDVSGAASATPVTNGIVRILTTGSNPPTGYGGGLLFTQVNSSGTNQDYASITGSRVNSSAHNKVDLVFSTGDPTGSIAVAERMRIDTSGNVLVGTTSVSGGRVNVLAAAGATGIVVQVSTNGNYGLAFNNASGTNVGRIQIDSASTSYVTSSDYRLKEDIAPMTGALAKVAALKPVTYKWKADGSDAEGFIAHELAEVCPQAVSGAKDEVDADGNPRYQGIDTSFLVATLTAAIQELTARVAALEAK